jgi:hypothetical protein
MSTLSKIVRRYLNSGVDDRRSSRIQRSVPLVILGTDVRGQLFREETSALSLNLHGCRYSSRHEYAIPSWVSVQMKGTGGQALTPAVRARVCSVLSPQTRSELRHVGVEFETPGNVWSIEAPPDDWQYLSGEVPVNMPGAVAMTPADEPAKIPLDQQQEQVAAPEPPIEVTLDSTSTPDPIRSDPEMEIAPDKAERVSATMDKLLTALQEKLELFADRAVEDAITTKLDGPVRNALERIDEASRTNVRRAEEYSVARIGQLQTRAEEIAQRLEQFNSDAKHNQSQMQKLVEHVTSELEPKLYTRLDASFARASKEMEQLALQLSERQFAYFTMGTQAVLQEALSQLESRAAATLPPLESAPSVPSPESMEKLKESIKEETLGGVETRLEQMRHDWKEQQEFERNRLEEIVQSRERVNGSSELDSNALGKVAERVLHVLEPRISAKLEGLFHRAAQDFEAAAARVSDRQLVRLMDEKQQVAREAALEIEASATEARALLQKSANVTFDEFQRRVGVHVDLTTAEAAQQMTSTLASLDAENRAACEARRRTLESDVANAAKQSTQEFRSGIKAFLYSCLVAAVSAVDEHAQTTLNGLGKNPGNLSAELMPSSGPIEQSGKSPSGDDTSR